MRFRVFKILPETLKPLGKESSVYLEFPEEPLMSMTERKAWEKWSEAEEGKEESES